MIQDNSHTDSIASQGISNKSVKLSARRVSFQSPGSGQEFAAAIITFRVKMMPAAQFLPLRLGSRSNCPPRHLRARPTIGPGANLPQCYGEYKNEV